MEEIFSFSEATTIGLHACIYLSRNQKVPCSTKVIAEELEVSYHHLTKVMQRLERYGVVGTIKGVKGGAYLKQDACNVTLWDIYVAIEGRRKRSFCIVDDTIEVEACILGAFLVKINNDIMQFLKTTTLSAFVER